MADIDLIARETRRRRVLMTVIGAGFVLIAMTSRTDRALFSATGPTPSAQAAIRPPVTSPVVSAVQFRLPARASFAAPGLRQPRPARANVATAAPPALADGAPTPIIAGSFIAPDPALPLGIDGASGVPQSAFATPVSLGPTGGTTPSFAYSPIDGPDLPSESLVQQASVPSTSTSSSTSSTSTSSTSTGGDITSSSSTSTTSSTSTSTGGGSSGGIAGPIPEPETWAMMIVGFFAVSYAMRAAAIRRLRRRSSQPASMSTPDASANCAP